MSIKVGSQSVGSAARSRVLHLSTVHSASDVRILHRECGSLAAAGYEVGFLVPHAQDEILFGVQIYALPKPKNRIDRMTRIAALLFKRAVKIDAAIYHFHDAELIPVALALKAIGKKVIYDVHEDVPQDVLDKPYLPLATRKLLSRLLGGLENACGVVMDGFLPATPYIARRFPAKKTKSLQNFPLRKEIAHLQKVPYSERKPWIAYVGLITDIRGISEMVASMAHFKELPDLRLQLMGKFYPPELQEVIQTLEGWNKVDYTGWSSREKTSECLAQCRAGILLFHPVGNHTSSQPNKLFEYMGAGLPIIASDFPAWKSLIETYQCGITVDPFDTQAVVSAIRRLITNPEEAQAMGDRGRKAVESIFNWDTEAVKLLQMYDALEGKLKNPNGWRNHVRNIGSFLGREAAN